MIAIVTGATGGIGLETARGLARAGARVIVAARDEGKGRAVAAEITASVGAKGPAGSAEPWLLDLARLASIRAFAARVRAELPRVDVLVANAGVWPRERRTTADGFELCLGVNHLGHAALIAGVHALLERSAARVVIVSSGLHARARLEWDDLMQARGRYDGDAAYAASKLANVMYASALARRLGGGATANACHPGVVSTGLTREHADPQAPPFPISPAKGARPSLHLALAPELATVTGRYFDKTTPRRPSALAMDRGAQERLWTVTEQLLRR